MASTERRLTIWIVEDDATLQIFYRSALMIAGYRVVTASDGVDALGQIEGDAPALIVLDIGLPRLGGRDVLAELKFHTITRNIPILIVSGSKYR